MKVTITKINDLRQVSDKFKLQTIWCETDDEKYPQTLEFQFSQDKVEMLEGLAEGMEVEIEYNLRGRKWTNNQGKEMVFVTLDVWKCTPVQAVTASETESNASSFDDTMAQMDEIADAARKHKEEKRKEVQEGEDDLPF